MDINVRLTEYDAQSPLRSNPTDAGADLFSPEYKSIPSNGSEFINFGVQMEIPIGYVGLIFARSGLGGQGIRPRNCVGVIDSKYRGNIGMMVENASDSEIEINVGDRIAQIVIMPIALPEFKVVEELCVEDDRGGGFGHTGR